MQCVTVSVSSAPWMTLQRQETMVVHIPNLCDDCMSDVQQSLQCALKVFTGLITVTILYLAG